MADHSDDLRKLSELVNLDALADRILVRKVFPVRTLRRPQPPVATARCRWR